MTPQFPLADQIRSIIIEQSKRANVGHIGSALSVADVVAALYGGILRLDGPRAEQDRFVLSKGHAALALYAALELTGRLPAGSVDRYCAEDSLLGVHPEPELAGVDFGTGSLGHGLPMGAGAALAARIDRSSRRVFVVMSDAELNEGSVWEAAMFAAHHRLANLFLIVDVNGQQALGYTRDVLNLPNLAARWKAFGWDAHDIPGHDPEDLIDRIAGLESGPEKPHVLLADTTFGKGVGFMERRIEWHYLPMTDAQFAAAQRELEHS